MFNTVEMKTIRGIVQDEIKKAFTATVEWRMVEEDKPEREGEIWDGREKRIVYDEMLQFIQDIAKTLKRSEKAIAYRVFKDLRRKYDIKI